MMMTVYQTIGECPLCGHELKSYNRAYGCSNWKKNDDGTGGCEFTIWKNTFGKEISEAEFIKLLAGEEIGPYELHTKDENYFEGKMVLDAGSSGVRLIFQ